MSGVFVPDCDCDAMDAIAAHPVPVRRFRTDAEACRRYLDLGPGMRRTEALHGPSGHLLAVRQ